MCSLLLCCWKRVFAMTSVFSWQNPVSLFPGSFCTPRPNLPVTPGISWLPTFAFQSPVMRRTSFLGVSFKGLIGLHRTIQLHLLQHYWLGHRLELLWYWMFALETNRDHSFIFEIRGNCVLYFLPFCPTVHFTLCHFRVAEATVHFTFCWKVAFTFVPG